MFLKSLVFLWAVGCCLSTHNCNEENLAPSSAEPVSSKDEERLGQLMRSNRKLTTFLYQEFQQNSADSENILFSPMTILSTLALLYGGADKVTKDQMDNVLKFGKFSSRSLHSTVKSVTDSLYHRSNKYSLRGATRFYAAKTVFDEDYIDLAKTFYRVNLHTVDFKSEEKDFSDKETELDNNDLEDLRARKIYEMLEAEKVDPSKGIVLIAAVSFKSHWAENFDKSRTMKDIFSLTKSKYVQVDMMYYKGVLPYAYIVDLNCHVVEIPYADRQVSLFILLPKRIGGLPAVEAGLGTKLLRYIPSLVKETTIEIKLPRFQFERHYTLENNLRGIGLEDIFVEDKADFSRMNGHIWMYVARLFHKASFTVQEDQDNDFHDEFMPRHKTNDPSEKKFKAEQRIGVNHPFLFFIRHNALDAILFFGRLSKPSDIYVKDEI
ncbi:leukocyte elastase inhibitor [Lingula anatina]|uniref:Leukocyte elastase inhibitor n=1 Tax=Lingula anatina TaxID=7574 RepID=A0A1S3IQQ8_LINAN|nr:leukocyte elastase inhibitor [Lingula anatina]|eukprot:XP_013399879.1 leukocyte elastase inhibitor [Lingula anatina]